MKSQLMPRLHLSRLPYGVLVCDFPLRCVYGLQSYDFLKKKMTKSAAYYKIVDATAIVGSRRIVGTSKDRPVESALNCKN